MASSPSSNAAAKFWQPPTPEELQELLPQYEITGMLGRGGMGAVYKGRQIALDRAVAVKILSNTLEEADASFVERFKNEARSMARLMHPGIVAVFDFGETPDGLLYIVMEFIEGTDVSRMLAEQKRLHTEHAVAITAHVLDALAYAHERGIIHRDIKPANVMVGYDGVVKVADFGLAKMGGGDGTAGLTQSGMAMGTLHFMAPEALTLGSAVDQRADIYAVGVMLYQMLTGRLPQGMFELPSLQVPGLDPRLDGIITKALRDDRELRYSCASEMRQDLDSARTQPIVQVQSDSHEAPAALPTEVRPRKDAGPSERTPQAPPRVPKPAPRSGALWLVAALLAGAAAASWLYLGMSRNKPEAQSAIATKEQPFENGLGMKFVPVPITGGPSDGQRVLFSIWETRVKDYQAFVDETNRQSFAPDFPQGNDHPVTKVSWEDAVAFCEWLTTRDRNQGILSAEERYRLPTDHEWSCAIGIGQDENAEETISIKNAKLTDVYHWGNEWPPPEGVGNYYGEETAQNPAYTSSRMEIKGYHDGFDRTAPVGSFAANAHGLYDLGGNLWEWCADSFSTDEERRVLRGGSWNNMETHSLASSYRRHIKQDTRTLDYGFRVVISTVSPSESVLPVSTPAGSEASKDKPFTNSLGMKFVPVPITGGPSGGQRVLFSIWETRVKDYEAFMRTQPDREWLAPIFPQESDHPALRMQWPDTVDFCDWLTAEERKEGLIGDDEHYRLPTDHEWSCALGIGPQEDPSKLPAAKDRMIPELYPWGGSWPPPPGAGNLYGEETVNDPELEPSGRPKPPIKGYKDPFVRTGPVGSFSANQFGLYDMVGNASEWCSDWYSGEQARRVLRGSSWVNNVSLFQLSSNRNFLTPGIRFESNGFRVVLAKVATFNQ